MQGGTTLTMEASIYPTSGNWGTIGGKEGEYLLSRNSDGTINWAVNSGNPGWTWYNTGYVAPLDTWTQLTLVVNTALNNGTIQLYANGVLVETYTGTAGNPMTPIGGWGGAFQIGARTTASEYFTGAIDEVRVWNTAHTASQVAGDYTTAPVPANDPNLKGYWPLNDGSGTVAHDQTANGNNGTLTGQGIQQGAAGAVDGRFGHGILVHRRRGQPEFAPAQHHAGDRQFGLLLDELGRHGRGHAGGVQQLRPLFGRWQDRV